MEAAMTDVSGRAPDKVDRLPVVADEARHSRQQDRSRRHQTDRCLGRPGLREQIVLCSLR